MKKVYLFILSLYPILLLRAGVFRLLFLTKFQTDQVLIANLLGTTLSIPYWVTALFGFVNMLLIFLIIKNLFDRKTAFFAYLIYGISPWSAYMEYSASIYIIFLTFLLLFFFGLVVAKKGRLFIGYATALVGFLALIYGSFLSWLILPFIIYGLYKKGYLSFLKNKYLLFAVVVLVLPLVGLSFKNRAGLTTTAKNQITVFSDVGLINTVNAFQGENRGVKPQILARLTENRYTYSGLHFIYSALNTINPINYFTPQYKMLGFSQNPAIFVGFLIPLSLGLIEFIKHLRKIFSDTGVFSLLIPAFLSKTAPDFARVLFFSPIIFLLIALGLTKLTSLKNKWWLYLSVALVVIQFLAVLIDIFVREPWRLYQLTGI